MGEKKGRGNAGTQEGFAETQAGGFCRTVPWLHPLSKAWAAAERKILETTIYV